MSDQIKKGGPGSGQVGHKTMHPEENKVVSLTNKLEQQNPLDSHLHTLKNGAMMEGHVLRSGKPLLLNMEQATAHGYTPADHQEAANIHYDLAQKMSENVEKLKLAGKPVPPAITQIIKTHQKAFKANMKQADVLQRRMAGTQKEIDKLQKPYFDKQKEKMKKSDGDERAAAAVERRLNNLMDKRPDLVNEHPEWRTEKCMDTGMTMAKCDCKKCMSMKKAVVMLAHQDGAEIDTGKFANMVDSPIVSEWSDRFSRIMKDYKYGDEPKVLPLDKGSLHLVKVDDGMYSGVFKHEEMVDGDAGPQMMVDNAKVRLERMTLQDLATFCIAKQWIDKTLDLPFEPATPQYMAPLIQKLEAPIQMSSPEPEERPLLTPAPPSPPISGPDIAGPNTERKSELGSKAENPLDRKIQILQLLEKLVN